MKHPAQMLSSTKLKPLDARGIGHHALIVILCVMAFAAFGAYRVFSSNAATTGHYFQQRDNTQLKGTKVFQLAAPPGSDAVAPDSPYWPATDFATAATDSIARSSWTGGDSWYFAWANRRNYGDIWNDKPNQVTPAIRIKDGGLVGPNPTDAEIEGSVLCRATYTTVGKANAATRAQIRFALGMDRTEYMESWLKLEGSSASDFITADQFKANWAHYCKTPFNSKGVDYLVMTDKVVLPAARLTADPRHAGVVLDYEVQDDRQPEVTQAFIHGIATDCHRMGKKLVLLTNPLNAPSQPHTALTPENIRPLFDEVDYITIMLWSKSREGSIQASYENQLKLLGPLKASDYKKLILYFELGNPGTTPSDAKWVYQKLHEKGDKHPTALMFWRNYAEQGEPGATATNRKMSLTLFNHVIR